MQKTCKNYWLNVNLFQKLQFKNYLDNFISQIHCFESSAAKQTLRLSKDDTCMILISLRIYKLFRFNSKKYSFLKLNLNNLKEKRGYTLLGINLILIVKKVEVSERKYFSTVSFRMYIFFSYKITKNIFEEYDWDLHCWHAWQAGS